MCATKCAHVVCVCERERERERVCVCVYMRERVCVCVCVRACMCACSCACSSLNVYYTQCIISTLVVQSVGAWQRKDWSKQWREAKGPVSHLDALIVGGLHSIIGLNLGHDGLQPLQFVLLLHLRVDAAHILVHAGNLWWHTHIRTHTEMTLSNWNCTEISNAKYRPSTCTGVTWERVYGFNTGKSLPGS